MKKIYSITLLILLTVGVMSFSDVEAQSGHCTGWSTNGSGVYTNTCVCQCGLVTQYTGVYVNGVFTVVKVEQL
jgi:hypothetical protein